MLNFFKQKTKTVLMFLIPISLSLVFANIFLFNRYKINNFAKDSLLKQAVSSITQSIYMYPDRTLKTLYIYSENNMIASYNVKISQGTNEFIANDISQYQNKDGSFRLPLNFYINSTNDLIIELTGDNLDKLLVSDNTLLGELTLNNMINTSSNIKISMIFWNDINIEQQVLLYTTLFLLLMIYLLVVIFGNEKFFYGSFTATYTLLIFRSVGNLDPHAEILSNFSYHAFNSDWWTALKTTDAGYLPLIPRLVTLIIVKLLYLKSLYIVLLYVFASFFGAMCISFFSLKSFRTIIELDRIRLLICLFLGIIFSSEGLLQIFNTPYYGVFVVFPILLVAKNNFSKLQFIFLLLFVPMVFLSKILFISLAPIYGILTLYYWHEFLLKKNLQKRELVFFTFVSFAMVMQVLYLLFIRISSTKTVDIAEKINPIEFLKYFPANFIRSLLPMFQEKFTILPLLSIGASIAIILWCLIFKYIKSTNNKALFYGLYGIIVAFIIHSVAVASLYNYWVVYSIYHTDGIRHVVIPGAIAFFICAIVFIQYLSKSYPKVIEFINKFSMLAVIALILVGLKTTYARYWYHISWEKYSQHLIKKDQPYTIPFYDKGLFALNYKTSYAGPLKYLTNYTQLNTLYILNKENLEQLTLKSYDKNNEELFSIPPFILEYNVWHDIYVINTNITNIDKIKFFNQKNIDRTKDLVVDVFTNNIQ